MRLVNKEEGRTLTVGQLQEGDDQFIYEGRTVLLVDAEAAKALVGRALDVEQIEEGARLSTE